jgi:hypothetical protein
MTLALSVLSVAASLALATWVGYCCVGCRFRSLLRTERLAWGLIAGLLIRCGLYGALLAVPARLPRYSLTALEVLVALTAFGLTRRRRPRLPAAPGRWSTGEIVSVGLIAILVAIFAFESLSEPMVLTDYLAIWGLRAKLIYGLHGLPGRIFHDPATFWSQPEYPLFLPLCLASLGESIGVFNDQAMALLFPVFLIATLVLLNGQFARLGSRGTGLVIALLAAGFAPLYSFFTVGMAEIPLALAFVMVLSACRDVLETPTRDARWRLLLASIFCVSVKQEGTVFVAVLGALWILWRACGRKHSLQGWAWLVLPAPLHALFLLAVRGPVHDRDFDLGFLRPSRWPVLGERLAHVTRDAFQTAAPVTIVLLVAAACVLLLTPRKPTDRLMAIFPVQAVVYLFVSALSAFDPIWEERNALPRLLATLYPAFLYLLGFRLASVAGQKPSEKFDSRIPGHSQPAAGFFTDR